MNNMNKKKTMLLTLVSILTLTLITLGVSLAFFNYMKKGTTENSVKTGTITFLYTEVDAKGAGISIEDALPMTDEQGKAQTGNGNVFNFKVTSTTTKDVSIPYEVTARQSKDSTLDNKMVRIYLTEVDGNTEKQLLLDNYNNLNQTSQSLVKAGVIEKTIYTDTVPASSTNYEKNFRLRMWVDENTDFSPVKDDNGNDTYPYNGKTFTITVNVYSNGKVVVAPTSRKLGEAIKEDNTLITTTPDLTKTVTDAGETSGLYSSTDTNSGDATYYFRGDVTNNNVKFAGLDWKVVRVNEDGTVKLVLKDSATTAKYNEFYYQIKDGMYYSTSDAKTIMDNWYKTNISEYGKYVAYENYCEQARTVHYSSQIKNSGTDVKTYDTYTPTFKCETDANGYGNVYTKIALLTYDEVVYAGNTRNNFGNQSTNYLYNEKNSWLMTPSGYDDSYFADVWMNYGNSFSYNNGGIAYDLRPVISLTSETKATGTGTEQDPYVVVIDSGDQSDNGALYVNSGSSLNTEIMKNKIITTAPTLTKTTYQTAEQGLYKSTDTNSGEPTYYFRGGVLNNYIKFADRLWRIIRINEDGTVRILMDDVTADGTVEFKTWASDLTQKDMYYSNSKLKTTVDNWYATNLQAYDSKIATSTFCEQARASDSSSHITGSNVNMTLYNSYTPSFKCETDANGYGIVNSKIGLITYDEAVFNGGYNSSVNYFITIAYRDTNGADYNKQYWTMSPAGTYKGTTSKGDYYSPYVWRIEAIGRLGAVEATSKQYIRPVINLNKDTVVTGTGTYSDPYIVK